MKVRVYDLFDKNFTCAVYSDVDWINGDTLVFPDGEEIKIDSEFMGIEVTP